MPPPAISLIASDPISSRVSSRFASIIITTASSRFSRASGSVLPFAYLRRAVPPGVAGPPAAISPGHYCPDLSVIGRYCGCLRDPNIARRFLGGRTSAAGMICGGVGGLGACW
jgi:hypothetical protein